VTDIAHRRPEDVSLGDWELAFARSPLGMAVVVNGLFVRINDALAELIGRTPAEAVGIDAVSLAGTFLANDEIDRAREAYRSGERRLRLQGPVQREGRDDRWVTIDAIVISTEPRVTTLATVTDLTDLHKARTEVAASERRFRSLLTNVSDTVSLLDTTGRLLYLTGFGYAFGYDEPFWEQHTVMDLVHPDDLAFAAERWEAVLQHPGVEVSSEFRVQTASGDWEDVAVHAINLLEDADVAGIVITTRAVTDQRRAERIATGQAAVLELIARGASLPAVAEACVDFVGVNGIDGATGIYLLEGERLELCAGRTPEELNAWMREPTRTPTRSLCDAGMVTGAPAIVADVDHSDLSEELRALAGRLGVLAGWSQPIQSIATSEPVGSLCTVFPRPHDPTLHEHQVADTACSLMAIALERRDNEALLAHQALHDGLTGLPNRTLLLDRLNHATARSERTGCRLAVLFCDIDRFKVINDSLGHGVGDQLLVAFADRLRAAVDPDETVARFGGDEFVVLLEDLDAESHPHVVAQRIARALETPFVLDGGQEVILTASIGLADGSGHSSGDAWLRDADAAMYRAKDRGRNQLVLFDSAMREAAIERLQVENDLRRAIDRNELVMHFQPIVDLAGGWIVGAEALIRWQHPEHGLLPPAAFIPVAEETGLIDAIGCHALDLAMAAASRLIPKRNQRGSRGRGFQLGVNVSARQLVTPGLDAAVAAACDRHGWPPDSLLLEITESALLHSADDPVDMLTRIHDLGAELAVDDFGTGYSSLTRLGHMPVSQVKIDATFVAAIDKPGDPMVRIVDAVKALAGALDLCTTAEGVETQAQLDYLRRLRCDLAQGYLFARPLPEREFAALLTADPRW